MSGSSSNPATPPPQTESGRAAVDAYLATVASPQRATLERLRHTIRSILPHAEEGLRYGMPAFSLGGKGVAGYAAFKEHCGYFPMSGAVLERAGDVTARYQTSKGGIRFGVDERLPVGVIRRLIKLRIEEISAVDNGRRCEYYDDGQLKAVGSMKDGKLHGKWKWYRKDGSLMRTGQFTGGTQVGTWTTWNPDGTEGKTTRFPHS